MKDDDPVNGSRLSLCSAGMTRERRAAPIPAGVRCSKSQAIGFSSAARPHPTFSRTMKEAKLVHCHARLRAWLLSKNAPLSGEKSGKRGVRPGLPNVSMWRSRPSAVAPGVRHSKSQIVGFSPAFGRPCLTRRFPFPSVPLPGAGALAPLPALAHRPAHPGRSARRGTLGRNLPGPRATLAHGRKRRPACHRRDRRSRRRNWHGVYGRFSGRGKEGWGYPRGLLTDGDGTGRAGIRARAVVDAL